MIFSDGRAEQILAGEKTATWRPKKDGDYIKYWPGTRGHAIEVQRPLRRRLWEIDRTYAVQPGRGKKSLGRIEITRIEECCPCVIGDIGLRWEGFRGTPDEMYAEFRAVLERLYPQHKGDVMQMPGYWIRFRLVTND